MANNKGRSQNLIKPSEMNPEEAKEFHSPTEYMELRNFLSSLEIAESEQNMQLAMAVSLIQKAISGDTRAFEVVRDTLGQKPVEKQEVKEFKSEWFK